MPPLSPEDRRLLAAWNDTARPYPRGVRLHELFEAQAARTPEVVAIRFEGESLAYAALEARANRIARALVRRGVGPGERVALLLERSLDSVAAFLAVSKSGAAYVPVDPDDPPARQAFMLEDAAPRAVATFARHLAVHPHLAERALLLDGDEVDSFDPFPLKLEGDERDPVYVLYTSGSTGQPKGAINSHAGVVNRLLWMQDEYSIGAGDHVLQKTPYSFDVSGWELFWPLLTGATSIVARPGGHRDSAYLAHLVREERVTHAHFVPSMLRLFLGDPSAERCTSLRQVVCSGEELPRALQDRFFEALPTCRLDNLYGPTEAAIDVTWWRCDPDDPSGSVPIGRPVANTTVHVLDGSREPVAVGDEGELYLGGVQVALGYHARPELTAERFVADPFSKDPDARLYRTGDLARWRRDGVLEFLGRIDHQVKIRGVRIELGEVDAALFDAPGVDAAVTVAHTFGDGDKRLVAYLVPKDAHEADFVSNVRAALATSLSDAMQPAAYVVLDALPLGATGKVDRKALPAPPEAEAAAPASANRSLRGFLEELWRDALRIDRVGAHEPFFEIGGNSLLAAQVVNRVQERLGEQVFVTALFEAPTIADFADFIERNYPGAAAAAFDDVAGSRAPAATVGLAVDDAALARFRRELDSTAANPGPVSRAPRPGPRAAFILSTHRSGTTLVRAMLAGHPGLFAAPELQLLGFETMAARQSAFSGHASLWLEGAIRAVMELLGCDAAEAERRIAEHASDSTQGFFATLQRWSSPRILIDKTPTYALDPAALRRAEALFEDARYIHLVRHPAGMMHSARQFHMEQIWPFGDTSLAPRQLAELVWNVSHANVRDFLAEVPAERWCRVRYEDVVREPEAEMQRVAHALGVPFHAGMLDPYADTERKMLDGIHAESMPMGDTKFHGHGRIEAGVADRWRRESTADDLGEATWNLAEELGYEREGRTQVAVGAPTSPDTREDIAIVGMAGRFPGAADVETFWRNLRDGVESIRSFSDVELDAAGVDAATRARPDFVNSGSLAEHLDCFDAEFFGVSKREAELMDPQHRVLLEVAWEALERAGYDPRAAGEDGVRIGVFGGVAPNTYRRHVERARPDLLDAVGGYVEMISAEREYAITRIAHKLDLRGPAISVATACSTSAVALHLACQSLRSGDSDICLVGGGRVRVPLTSGYVYTEDGIPSPDGHCRAFDADAQGTAIGNGMAMIAIKRLSDALADGDHIHAVVKGSAIDNDGSAKVGYTAPGVRGQTAAIAAAIDDAGVSADSISYLEAHGTGTAIGDPIEITAATQAFRRTTDRTGFCAVGALKTNIGHLDAGAGVAGVIKAALTLEHRELPPTLHFRRANPQIDFARSPFFVNDRLRPWIAEAPRRAGVSSFGLGGTNAHVVLEEAPVDAQSPVAAQSDRPQLIVWSARGADALGRATERLATHLATPPSWPGSDSNLADVAWTLQRGRRHFEARAAIVASSVAEAAERISDPAARIATRTTPSDAPRPIAFLFPGGGAQYVGMGRDLFAHEPVFREALDRCLGLASDELEVDLAALLYPDGEAPPEHRVESERPSRALPLLFSVEYALAELWRSWGVEPDAMLGHSMGEYTAACLAGVVTVEQALRIVIERGRLFERLDEGAMLSVPLPADDPRLVGVAGLSIAAINRPSSCVASGPVEAIDALERALAADDIEGSRVHISVAAHSSMLEPILDDFRAFMRTVELRTPTKRYLSNVTGTWIRDDEATDPDYWVRHLRSTVRFADGLDALAADGERILIEIGPGQTLSTFARQHAAVPVAVSSLRHPREVVADDVFLLQSLGRVHVEGGDVDFAALHGGARRRRVPLPTYPFARTRHWIDAAAGPATPAAAQLLPVPAAPPAAATPPTMTEPDDRAARVLSELVGVVQELTGLAPDQVDPHATFLELGFDSLLLTQANGGFKRRFDVPLGLRQLFEETPTLDRLAAYIDAQLPADAFPPPASAQATAPVPPTSDAAAPVQAPAADAPLVERVIHEQMELMRQQLALLGGAPAPPPPAAPAQPAAAPAPTSDDSTPARLGPWNPPEKGAASDGFTPEQRAALDALIERFTARTPGSKRYAEEHRNHYADPRTAAGFRLAWKELVYPILADRAKGARLWDVDGNEWLDVTMGFGVTLLGHSPDYVVDAVRAQLEEGMAIGPQTSHAGEVARLLCEITGYERAALCNTGSEAVLAAIRTARTVHGRDLIVMFAGSYHGMFDEVVVRGAQIGGEHRSLPLAPGIPKSAVGNVLVLEYGDSASLEAIAARADEIAAVLVEPIQSRNPELQPREFVQDLRRLTAERDIALVFDEMVTGFRLGLHGAQAFYGVEADIGTFGKVLGGGMPIGAIAGKARYLDALDGGPWQFGDDSIPEAGVTWFAGTFVRHPLAIAAAKATLTHLRDEGPELQERLNARAARLRDEANAWFDAHDYPVHLAGFSSQFMIQFRPQEGVDPEHASLYFHFLRDRSVHCHERRPHFLTTAHTEADLEELLEALQGSAEDMRAGGFFPAPDPVEKRAPLTPAQQEIWLASRFDADASRAFHLSASMDLEGELDQPALRRALSRLVLRHDALRIRIAPDGESQEVLRHVDLALEAPDSGGAEFHASDAERPFDLEAGPLARFALLRRGPAQQRLVLTAHHIVCDGWSLGILMRDLGALYASEGGASAPSPPALNFAEYATQRVEAFASPSGAAAEAYWLESLAGELPMLELPTDRPRPKLKTYGGGQRGRLLDAAAFARIEATARAERTTPFALLLAAYSVFLKRLATTDDVVLGIATAGQPAAGCGDLVGHCVSLYPLRARAPREAPFTEHAAELQSALLDSMDHADCTYGALLAKLDLPRDPSRLPLLSTLVTYETETAGLAFGDLGLAVANSPKRYCNFDVELYLTERDGGLLVEFHYNLDLFDAATIERWLENYATLVDSVSAGAAKPAEELELLGSTEFSLMEAWNDTAAPVPSPSRVDALVAAQARRTPAAIAVKSAGLDSSALDYASLDADANRIARHLVERGVRRGDCVAVCLPREPRLAAAILGIWRAGAAYVPLDATHPRARIEHALEDSGARLVVTAGDTWTRGQEEVLDLDADGAALDAVSAAPLDVETGEDDVAYVLYTSGSTGVPKGVEVPHRAVANLLESLSHAPGFTAGERLLSLTTIAFDISVVELWLPLTQGGEVVLGSAEDALDGKRIAALLEEHDVSVLQATPATWRLLFERGWQGRPGLRVMTGGEALAPDLAARLVETCGEVWNLYGPTETTVYSTGTRITEADLAPTGRITIGGPIANTRVQVVDRCGRPAPIGAAGELEIAGAGVARGYRGRDELTAERFVGDRDGRRYRTGDLVRWTADGTLEFLGRGDSQVKLRGFRIELGEIEASLTALPAVRSAAAALCEEVPGGPGLVAYVVAEGAQPTADALRDALRQRLPEYMVPTVIVELDELPLTPNGKLDRRALPAPTGAHSDTAREIVPPRTETEAAMVEIWSDVLGVPQLGATDDFFDLGGYSLLAARVLARVEERFGVAVPLRQLFQATTLGAFSDVVDALVYARSTTGPDADEDRFELEL